MRLRSNRKIMVRSRQELFFNIPGRELAPIIYMEPFYDQARSGEPLDKIMDDIVQVSEKALGVQELPKEINPANYDSIKGLSFPADHQHKSEIRRCYR